MRTRTLALLVSACGPKKPAKSTAPELSPLVEDATWTYRATFNGRTMTEEKVCVRASLADGKAWIFLEAEDVDMDTTMVFPNMFGLGVYRRTADGIETADARWRSDLGEVSLDSLAPGVGLVRWELVTGRVEELQSWSLQGG